MALMTKRDVARRQLLVAIRLLWAGEDLVAVYSLATNAWEIVDTLASFAGIDSASNQVRRNLGAGEDLRLDYINSPHRNFFKHAKSDPTATVPPLKEGNVDGLIFLAVEDYIQFYGSSPVEFQAYQLWYLAMHEEKISSHRLSDVLQYTRQCFPGIRQVPRPQQLQMAQTLVASMRDDPALIADSRTEPSR